MLSKTGHWKERSKNKQLLPSDAVHTEIFYQLIMRAYLRTLHRNDQTNIVGRFRLDGHLRNGWREDELVDAIFRGRCPELAIFVHPTKEKHCWNSVVRLVMCHRTVAHPTWNCFSIFIVRLNVTFNRLEVEMSITIWFAPCPIVGCGQSVLLKVLYLLYFPIVSSKLN